MRSVECPDAAAVRVSAREGLADFGPVRLAVLGQQAQQDSGRPPGDSGRRPVDSVRPPVDSVQLPASAHLARARAASHRSLLRAVHSLRGHLYLFGAILSDSTARLDFAAFIVLGFLMAASDASRPSSSAADCSWDRHSILLTMVTITPITMERHRRRSRLS